MQRINNRSTRFPGKFPGAKEKKQANISQYFGRKSPKAEASRKKYEEKTEIITKKTFEGVRNNPLSGDPENPRPQQGPSKGLGPVSEVRGRSREMEEQKRIRKVLERWPPDSGANKQSPQLRKQMKRQRETAKHRKEGTQKKWMGWCLREWLEKEKEGNGNVG